MTRDQTLHNLSDSDIFWDRIISLQDAGPVKTLRLDVEGGGNHVANDILIA